MSFNLSDVHHLERVQLPDGTAAERITHINPHMAIGRDPYPPIWLCEGSFYSEDGTRIDELPGWAYEEIEKISDKALMAHGFEERPMREPPAVPSGSEETPTHSAAAPQKQGKKRGKKRTVKTAEAD